MDNIARVEAFCLALESWHKKSEIVFEFMVWGGCAIITRRAFILNWVVCLSLYMYGSAVLKWGNPRATRSLFIASLLRSVIFRSGYWLPGCRLNLYEGG